MMTNELLWLLREGVVINSHWATRSREADSTLFLLEFL
jgi:hypothetical protein